MEAAALTSPLSWVGGKHAAARRIVAAFPPAASYGTYVDVFGGAAHVLLAKPTFHHLEVYNDLSSDLVNFWMVAREQPEALQACLETLPFSRQVYMCYRARLQGEATMTPVERAACWFYVMRSTFGGGPDGNNGWGYSVQGGYHRARSLRTATELLTIVARRFRLVQIECQDFARLITTYQTPRTLFYCDPPYIGCEEYYNVGDTPVFTPDDHARLATLLNGTPALVALS
jgi:DNA adenine methylase